MKKISTEVERTYDWQDLNNDLQVNLHGSGKNSLTAPKLDCLLGQSPRKWKEHHLLESHDMNPWSISTKVERTDFAMNFAIRVSVNLHESGKNL